MKCADPMLHSVQFNIISLCFFTLLLSGCGGTTCPPTGCISTVPVKIENGNFILSPSFRVGTELSDSAQAASDPHTGHAIELGIAQASGSGDQYIAGNTQVILNNSSIVGPQNLNNKFDLYVFDIAYRWRKFPMDSPLGVELSAGLGFPSLNLEVSSPTKKIGGSYSSAGLQAGIGLIWRLSTSNSIQARMSGFTSGIQLNSSNPDGVNSIKRSEFGFTNALNENLTLRVGYSDWTIKGNGVGSNFALGSSGPTIVFDWDFHGEIYEDNDQSDSETKPLSHTNDDESIYRIQQHPAPRQMKRSAPDEITTKIPKGTDSVPPEDTPSASTEPNIAPTEGFQVTVGIGYPNFANSPLPSDTSKSSFRIGGSYAFNSFAGLETGLSTGDERTDDSNFLKYSAAHFAATISYQYTDKFGIFSKLGVAHTTLSHSLLSAYGAGSGKGKKTNPVFGIGWKLDFSRHFGIRVQFEDFGKIPLAVSYASQPYNIGFQLFSVSGVYNF